MMRSIRQWAAKAIGLVTRKRLDQEFDAEIESHLRLLTERFVRQGMSPAEAAIAARRQFGNVTLLQERQRAQWSFVSPADWLGDVRFGLRMLWKKPASNLAVALALALGIGINVAVFSFASALLLRPPAGVSARSSLLEIWLHSRTSTGAQSYLPFTYPDYAYYRDQSRALEGVLAFNTDGSPAIWDRSGEGQVIQGQLVSGNFFSLLGVQAMLGRVISTGDDQSANPHPVVVLSDSFWQRELGSDPGVVGRTMILNGAVFSVVGVAPPGFADC